MIMRRRSCDYFYKTSEVDNKSSLDRKRYEYLNEFGINMDSNKKKVVDFDLQIKRHKNSESR